MPNFYRLMICLIVFFFNFHQSTVNADEVLRKWAISVANTICQKGVRDQWSIATEIKRKFGITIKLKSDLESIKNQLNFTHPQRGDIAISMKYRNGKILIIQFQLSSSTGFGLRPKILIRFNSDCKVGLARELEYRKRDSADFLIHFDPILGRVKLREPLNPAVPNWFDSRGVRVAHLDSGVNYLLPLIYKRLARDDEGFLVGWDFWEDDARPFDLNISGSSFFPFRHGTSVASVFLREAPTASLVPFRYPNNNMSKLSLVIDAIVDSGAEIVMMPMGSKNLDHWQTFRKKVIQNPELLFIVSAGNDGVNIDEMPIYPATFKLENIIVVTSSDDFGRLASGSNWGDKSVDLMVPGERIPIIDHRGAVQKASGSSYAVPRIAALAARLKKENPSWQGLDLKHAIFARAIVPRMRGKNIVNIGWIPNPLIN